MGVGVLIRDRSDNCLLAGNKLIRGIVLPEIAEAMAIRRAIPW
uniref:RNase H type-1 domain-containing protein n=1 Tax=Oryza punctata TaxID=4537 RepID=A0A0E0JIK6_ORYPU